MATANVNTVYATPESWGNETEYATAESMETIIAELKELGGDWEGISLSDCEEFSLGIDDENSTAHISRRGEAVKLESTYRTGVYRQKQS